MEHSNAELAMVEKAVVEGTDKHLCELNDLQLALVGGGVGETVLS